MTAIDHYTVKFKAMGGLNVDINSKTIDNMLQKIHRMMLDILCHNFNKINCFMWVVGHRNLHCMLQFDTKYKLEQSM
jgi:hypothetical protein